MYSICRMMNALFYKRSARRASRRAGFTLIEAALTTIIVGLGTVAMMGLLTSGLSVNEQAGQITTAVNLAQNIHELCDRLPFPPSTTTTWGIPSGSTISSLLSSGNISWLNGVTFNNNSTPLGPIDANLATLQDPSNNPSNWSLWSQAVTVTSVNSSSLSTNASSNSVSTSLARVTVTIFYSGQQVYQSSWLVAH